MSTLRLIDTNYNNNQGMHNLINLEGDNRLINVQQLLLGNVKLYEIDTTKNSIDSGDNYSATDDIANIFVTTLISGEAQVEQDENEFSLTPGEFAILSQKERFQLNFKKDSRYILVQIPEEIFFERMAGRDNQVFEPTKLHNTGLVPVIVNLLKSLMVEIDKMSETDQYTLTNTLLELTWACIRASTTQQKTQQHDSQVKLLRRIMAYMELNYADCELTPKTVASANGISIRYLHRLFQQSGMAVSKWIWERRLKATREDLTDPTKMSMRVSEIAFLHGFNDPAHFSRSFRERYNISPSKLRIKVGKEHELAGLTTI